MSQRLMEFLKKLILGERTPKKLALASSLGLLIAVSPFFGLHWLMTIVLAAILQLNIGVMYAVAHVVNNPFTMVPIYLADYKIGLIITQWLFGSDLAAYNPCWMGWLNSHLASLQIPNLSLLAFLIGGNVVGIVLAIVSYPLFLVLYRNLIARANSNKINV